MTRYPEVIEKVIRKERIPLAERLRVYRTLPVQGDIPRGITAKDIVVGACVLGGVILVGYLLYRGVTAKSVSPPIPETKPLLGVEIKQPPKEPVSSDAKAKARAYRQTEKYKAAARRYRQSEKGKAAAKRAREKRKRGIVTLKAESLKATVESDKKVKLETKKKGKVKKKGKKPDKKADKTVTTPAKAPKEEATKTKTKKTPRERKTGCIYLGVEENGLFVCNHPVYDGMTTDYCLKKNLTAEEKESICESFEPR